MTHLKTADEIEKKIEIILTNAEKQREQLQAERQSVANSINDSIKAMDAATAAGDTTLYKRAKDKMREHMDAKEMIDRRLQIIAGAPIIKEAEYNEMINGVYSEFEELNKAKAKKILALADKMQAEAAALENAINHANAVLYNLQHNVYRNADKLHRADGSIVDSPATDKKIDNWSTVFLGKIAAENDSYKTLQNMLNDK